MNFQGLKNVETSDEYIDIAFSRAKKNADGLRESTKGSSKSRIEKTHSIELKKIVTIRKTLATQLNLILKSFPSVDALPEFYNELIRITLDYELLKKALGGVNWALKSVDTISNEYFGKIIQCKELEKVNNYRREYYGRISSVIKQIKKALEYLEYARKIMKDFPSIKSNHYTVCIAGFPNVGKSTLLNALTEANAEVNSYAFTTKGLNTGYIKSDYGKVQFIDTPGTLNRFDKMNDVEKQAYLAIKYCADLVIFIFDLTEEYDLADQIKLLTKLNKFGKETIIYVSKTDILDKKVVDSFLQREGMRDVFTDKATLKKTFHKRLIQYNQEKKDY